MRTSAKEPARARKSPLKALACLAARNVETRRSRDMRPPRCVAIARARHHRRHDRYCRRNKRSNARLVLDAVLKHDKHGARTAQRLKPAPRSLRLMCFRCQQHELERARRVRRQSLDGAADMPVRVPHIKCRKRRARRDEDVVPGLHRGCGKRAADGARSNDGDVAHRLSVQPLETIDEKFYIRSHRRWPSDGT